MDIFECPSTASKVYEELTKRIWTVNDFIIILEETKTLPLYTKLDLKDKVSVSICLNNNFNIFDLDESDK